MVAAHDVIVTRHAAERAVQRLGCYDLHHATAVLRQRWLSSLPVPPRYARELCRRPSLRRQPGIRMRVSGSTLLVCRGTLVITTWRLSPEQLATVLWWTVANIWS